MQRVLLASALLLLWMIQVQPAHAEGLRSLALPASQGGPGLASIAERVSQIVANAQGLAMLEASEDEALGQALDDGIALARMGKLEDASRALQSKIFEALEAPHLVRRDAPLLEAMTQLATIALAAGDDERADDLFVRILDFDPAFELPASTRSPRVDASFRRATKIARGRTTLALSTVGRACEDGASILVVARGLRDGSVELTRFDRCRFTARVRGSGTSSASALAAALDPGRVRSDTSGPAFYQRPWFWAGTGAAAVVATTALYFLVRDDSAPGNVTIRPIL